MNLEEKKREVEVQTIEKNLAYYAALCMGIWSLVEGSPEVKEALHQQGFTLEDQKELKSLLIKLAKNLYI